MEQDNLVRLRELVGVLETQEDTFGYEKTLKEVEGIIKEELKIINNLKKTDSKLRHYETICTSILSVISATKL